MNIFKFYLIGLFCFLSLSVRCGIAGDSTIIKSYKFDALGSVSFINVINWNYNNFTGIVLYADCDFSFSKRSDKMSHLILSGYELGVSIYIDSISELGEDQFRMQYLAKPGLSRFSKTFNAKYETGFFNSYDHDVSGTGSANKVKTGSLFSPSQLDLGFGFGYTFGERSFLNISLTSAKFSIEPNDVDHHAAAFQQLVTFNGSRLYFDYGLACQLFVSEDLTNLFSIKFNGDVFLATFKRDELELDVSGTAIFNINDILQLRLENKLYYKPAYSLRVQLKNEMLVGIYFSREK